IIKYLTVVLLLVVSASGQELQRRAGGGGQGFDTSSWPKAAARPGMSDAEIVKALGDYLGEMSKGDYFSGTVLLAKNGKPLFTQSSGLADRDFNVPNNNDTKYNLASINKIFTDMALVQLRDAGKLDFSKTVRTYLPDYPNELADKVTIDQLMHHTSGMGDIFGPEFDATPKNKLRTLQDHLPLFAGKPLEFEPGTRTRYSNAGYVVLGLVIEKLTGASYYDYVREHVFKPAGMTSTDSYFADAVVPNRAVGYTRGRGVTTGERRANFFLHGARGTSAGGGYSTAGDLLRFANALLAGKIISRASVVKHFNVPADGPDDKPVMLRADLRGGAQGANTVLSLQGEWVLIALANYDGPAAGEVARNFYALLGRTQGD
ncbi:MAG TPA: serine hydrolase domain-containing protein, partial [Thermoanaerobaculia bacterium]